MRRLKAYVHMQGKGGGSKIRICERTYFKGDVSVGDLFQRNKIT